jgi:hypothetical protein
MRLFNKTFGNNDEELGERALNGHVPNEQSETIYGE